MALNEKILVRAARVTKIHLNFAIVLVFTGAIFWFGYSKFLSPSHSEETAAASIIGVHHFGEGYLISDFYIDKYGAGGVQRSGGGGSIICCVILPLKWRPNLTTEIRWRVEDWTRANYIEIDAGNYESVTQKGMYIAKVAVEKYDEPHDLYVHFFPRGRVRVLSTMYAPTSLSHPVLYGRRDSDPLATAGWPINEMFSQAEWQLMSKERNTWK